MSIGSNFIKKVGTKTADLATVPLNLVGGLFGNPFDPLGGHQVINTQSQIDFLNNLANQSGKKQGILSYGDYGTNFNLSDLKDPTAFSTAMTMGGTGFTKADTGDITYSGGKYDFDGAVPFIDQGGLMGKAYNLGGGLANLVNDIKQKNPGVTGTNYFDDVDISQPPGTNVGIMNNLANLFGFSAMADEVDKSVVNVDNVKSAIDAAKNREALNKQGLLSLDDAGLISPDYEDFAQKAKPGLNLGFAKQLGKRLGTGILSVFNPFVGAITGLANFANRTGLPSTFKQSDSLVEFARNVAQQKRDKKAREEAARRGEIKDLQGRIDRGDFGGTGGGGFKGAGGYGSSAERGAALHG